MSSIERLKVVDYVLESLDKPDPEIERAWGKEAASRLRAYKQGKIKAIPYEKVMGKYK